MYFTFHSVSPAHIPILFENIRKAFVNVFFLKNSKIVIKLSGFFQIKL